MTYADESAPIDREAAATVHFTDERVRTLATARWQLETGGSYRDWLALGKDDPAALIREGRDWMRAAVAAGLLPAPEPFVPYEAPTAPAGDDYRRYCDLCERTEYTAVCPNERTDGYTGAY